MIKKGETMTTKDDLKYMQRALELARMAEGETSPNPMVGCVIVKDNKTIGEGWHHQAGLPHAELEAIKDAKNKVRGATVYVTLEPCSHVGKVGPCCVTLARMGVARVVCAMVDLNPKVAGAGIKYLQEAGVAVEVGLCEQEAKKLNEKFLFAITHDRPFVSLKYAMTLDGKIATANGDSQWITGEEARTKAHYLRKTHDAILVGVGTVLQDNPELTTRLVKGVNPLRIVLDAKLQTPLTSVVLNEAAKTLIFVGNNYNVEHRQVLEQLEWVEIIQVPEVEAGMLDLQSIMQILQQREIRSVLVEGGSRVLGAFRDACLADRVYAFVAPKICGGQNSLSAIGGKGIELMDAALQLEDLEIEKLGNDVLLTAKVKEKCSRV
ncbi:MAG: bifunctional diaminohydroxyphosphoribosylaminopyrimidine deaminase/5-amino-6-(5-phosphoribosylamino)uracil reductase RibD [Acidaminococcaceae bacterium]|nr:bifunctional diaminohydroxyphosphoribosylaminopyrimidine deaminase/5-amino-6-(5-phosphoribosylamino)uracil reductase RibD [Acidaminococcaceae bacterium]MDO4935839.1 bifunctional diaminohydroxyphosphoribosylaminopyrimidine deaminase/5-amino-6-(5-phosphoribosylamino)uracil reductase RibD [Phascolarctobacterium sp.]